MIEDKVLVTVEGLCKTYKSKAGSVSAVDNVSFSIRKGETLALVGESGCGKSTIGKLLMMTLKADSGSIRYDGEELLDLSGKQQRELRRKIQMIFQDPYASLDPRLRADRIIGEPLAAFGFSAQEREQRVLEMMARTGIPQEHRDRYPYQFSGGQRQRIGIARALALHPEFVVCDEPVSALDVSIQAQILNLLEELQRELGLTYLFISHDLGVVHHISDRVMVVFRGRVCEIGDTDAVFAAPRHPYTRLLLESTPRIGRRIDPDAEPAAGERQGQAGDGAGCRFAARCPYATALCTEQAPPLITEDDGRQYACHHPLTSKEA